MKVSDNMYAVVAHLPNGGVHLIGFANTQQEIDDMIEQCCAANGGAESLKARGFRFSVELGC